MDFSLDAKRKDHHQPPRGLLCKSETCNPDSKVENNEHVYLDTKVYYRAHCVDNLHFKYHHRHPNQLRCLKIDHTLKGLIYKEYDEPFSSALKSMDLVRYDVRVPYQSTPLTPPSGFNVLYVPEDLRAYINAMFWYLHDTHKKNRFTNGIKLGNRVVRKGRLVFDGLTHDNVCNGADQNRRKRQDYSCIYHILKNIFGEVVLPADMRSLIEALRNRRLDLLSPNHLALLTHKKREYFLERVHQHLSNDTVSDDIINRYAKIGNSTSWIRRIKCNCGPFTDCFCRSGYFPSALIPCYLTD